MDVDTYSSRWVYQRPGTSYDKPQKICYQWRAGRCNRFPCPYLHGELPGHQPQHHYSSTSNGLPKCSTQGIYDVSSFSSGRRSTSSQPKGGQFHNNGVGNRVQGRGSGSRAHRKTEKLCTYWVQGNCSYGEKCKYLHSWSTGNCFSSLTSLEGHQKAICGIALPSGSDKLYTGSKDKTVRLWDCQSGQCSGFVNCSGEVGCLISEGPWLFVGTQDSVQAWNPQNNVELSLSGPVGKVYALVVGNAMLFAGVQDGSILAWKFNAVSNCFEPAASLNGHTHSVVTLVVGANKLYSGSMDHSIRVWNLENLQCVQTLSEHNEAVMSLLCWEQFLLSCSFDGTIKVWVATETGNMEVTYTHTEGEGVIQLCGMHDSEGKPVLLCSCNNNTVHAYDLPSFSERGKIFAKAEIRSIQPGPGGLFFTGDARGEVRVWYWLTEAVAPA